MTQEDIELLATDISGRVKHGVQVMLIENEETIERYKLYLKPYPLKPMTVLAFINYDVSGSKYKLNLGGDIVCIEDCKPFLRPMSDMSEEEKEELKELCSVYIPTDSKNIGFEDYGILVFTHHLTDNSYSFKLNLNVIDWLNKKGFDYRGLLEKGLAIGFYFHLPKVSVTVEK
jgi:hypothetical protein